MKIPAVPTAKNGSNSQTYVQPRMAKLPICQSAILRRSSEKTALNVVRSAFKKSERTMPHRMIVLFDIDLSIREENAATKKTVASPKIKPVSGRENALKNGRVIPLMMIIPAPKDAPDETPKMYGEASGLRKMDWQTAPLIAKHPPARNASSTRGRRRSHTIETFFGSIFGARGM